MNFTVTEKKEKKFFINWVMHYSTSYMKKEKKVNGLQYVIFRICTI